MQITVAHLADYPEHIETVAQWLWEQWGHANGYTVRNILCRTHLCLNKDEIPQTYIALSDGEPVGTTSLWYNDCKLRPDLWPWIAGVFVQESQRKLGIARRLVGFGCENARRLGFNAAYLMTDLEGVYENMGWEYLGQEATDYQVIKRLYTRQLITLQ